MYQHKHQPSNNTTYLPQITMTTTTTTPTEDSAVLMTLKSISVHRKNTDNPRRSSTMDQNAPPPVLLVMTTTTTAHPPTHPLMDYSIPFCCPPIFQPSQPTFCRLCPTRPPCPTRPNDMKPPLCWYPTNRKNLSVYEGEPWIKNECDKKKRCQLQNDMRDLDTFLKVISRNNISNTTNIIKSYCSQHSDIRNEIIKECYDSTNDTIVSNISKFMNTLKDGKHKYHKDALNVILTAYIDEDCNKKEDIRKKISATKKSFYNF